MADGLTRVRWIEGRRHPESKRQMFKNDSLERIFRLGGEDLLDAEDEGYVEDEGEVYDVLGNNDFNERFEIFSKYHNSIWYLQHFEGHVIGGGATMAGHAKRRYQMDRRMLNLSED